MPISRDVLLKLARAGATARVRELQAELDAIYASFPDLRGARRGRPAGASKASRAGRRSWSAADKKAAGDRMRKYWAARKKAEASRKADGKK